MSLPTLFTTRGHGRPVGLAVPLASHDTREVSWAGADRRDRPGLKQAGHRVGPPSFSCHSVLVHPACSADDVRRDAASPGPCHRGYLIPADLIPHVELGEEVGAAVKLKPGATATPAELRAFARERVAAYKYPRHVWLVRELPKGPSGKILHREVQPPQDLLP
jgi:acyl-CoA synthetase (AMP-forming)/AMP-acid ligase II